MRIFSDAAKELMNEDVIKIFYLVSVEGKNISMKHTSAPYDITNELGTFVTGNGLMSVEPPRMSSVVDREAYKVIYSDNDFEWRVKFEQGITGAVVTVYIGLFNITSGVIAGYNPGEPLSAVEHLMISYQGFVDNASYNIDPDEEVMATLECSSPMADLDLKKPFYTSKDAALNRSLNSGADLDTAFDQVHEGSIGTDLKWGKV